jgi:DNA-binding transcriptional regulator YhcF (GntR family)
MKFWFSRDSDVSIREQFVKQVRFGILSGDLQPGERLPSLRDMARRFQLHPNTLSAAYRQLEEEGWLELRRGSGVYVRSAAKPALDTPAQALDEQIAGVFNLARAHGIPLSEVKRRLEPWLAAQPHRCFLVIEPDPDLRAIVIAEISQAVRLPVEGCDLEESKALGTSAGCIPVVLPSKAEIVRQLLPSLPNLMVLQIRSIPSSLAGWLPAFSDRLVGIASRCPDFLTTARTMLIAAGFAADALLLRDAREADWHRGLRETVAVVCDTVTAKRLPESCRAICFPLLAEGSIETFRSYEDSTSSPLPQGV